MTGRDVARLRECLGMTQAEFADLVHVSQASVSQWERGETRVSKLAAEMIRLKTADARPSPALAPAS